MNWYVPGTFIIFFAVYIIIGIAGIRKTKSGNGFFVGERKAGAGMVAGSLLATIIGGSSTLGIAGLGYSQGLTGAWWMLAGSLGLMVLSFGFAGRVRETGAYTLPEILGRQYRSRAVRVTASLVISLSWIGIIAAQVTAAGNILSMFWPSRATELVVVFGTVCTAYTVIGGQYSVLRTDMVQSLAIVIGIVLCIVIGAAAAGGISGIKEQVPAGHFSFPLSGNFTVSDLLVFIFFVGTTFLAGPDMFSRVLSSRGPAAAKRALVVAALVMIPLAFGIALVGAAARSLVPGIPPEQAFPELAYRYLPAGLRALVLAALLAAFLSSADTCLLTTGTTLSADVINPLTGYRFGDAGRVALSRVIIAVSGALSVVMALAVRDIIDSLLLAYTVYSSGLVLPVLLGFFSERLKLNSAGVMVAVAGGGTIGLYLKLSGQNPLFCYPVSLLLLFAVSYGVDFYRRKNHG